MRRLVDVESFGAIDADADKLLDACFEDHEAYLAARSRSKFLVLGRKGSGKTAIYRKLLKDARHDSFSFGHDFTDYPRHLHDKQRHAGVPEETPRFRKSCGRLRSRQAGPRRIARATFVMLSRDVIFAAIYVNGQNEMDEIKIGRNCGAKTQARIRFGVLSCPTSEMLVI
jgi:Cdc6-like AAA superfamily ATPase